jgi:predicted carbohydrate-binding protein with CBM5 and CBM33 domain
MEKEFSSARKKGPGWKLLVMPLAIIVIALISIAVVSPSRTVQAHGSLESPASRTYACYLQGPQNPTTPACQAAVTAGGTQPLYDWFGVLNSNAAGRTVGYIPDGQLCSGANPKYAAYDVPRADWPATNLNAGSPFTFTYGAWVPHPGYFRFYVTNSTYNPTKPLTWANLQSTPFLTVNPEPAVVNGAYTMSGTLPSNVTGRQIIYVVWTRSDSNETFYSCSDVVFGVGGVFPTPTPTPPPTCTATAAVSNIWPGGYQASVTVKNTGSIGLVPWVISWTVPATVSLISGWNATVIQDNHNIVASAPPWQISFPAGGTETIGYVANGPAVPGPTAILLDGVTCT